jgi:hypothetical protein
MGVLAAVFIAKLLSPEIIIIGIAAGYLATRWWHVAAGAVVAATVSEILLSIVAVSHQFVPAIWIIALIAGAVWAGAAWLLRRKLRRTSLVR